MHSYGQFCPIARASEILGERWSMIIVRNLSVGCTTFTEIAEGAPGLSRPLLSKRLRELQRAGLIEIRPKSDGHGSLYVPTQAGREFPTMQGGGRRGWLLVEHGHAEICEKDPRFEEDLVVMVNDPLAFARWHLGQIRWDDALRGGGIQVTGDRELAKALPTWDRRVAPDPTHARH